MPLLEQILTGVRQKLEGELSSNREAAFPATARSLNRASMGQAPRPIYQISPLPLSLNLAEYRDAWSGANPKGDPLAAFRFHQLVDPMPDLSHEYSRGSSSIERIYGQIIQGASAPAESSYVTSMLAEAKRIFDMSGQSNLATQDEWRLVEAVPDDWYTDNPDRYSWLEIPLDGSEPNPSSSLLGSTTQLMLTLGEQGPVPLSGATNLRRCRIQYMFVQFNRSWLNYDLFKTAGWWLTGQPTGFCSSGHSDDNDGVLRLITTGMVITRAIEFDGLSPTDQARIGSALKADQDVYIGPFSLKKPGETVSSVNVVVWRSELVPFSPQSIAPSSGNVRVTNKGGFVAKYVVTWELNGKHKAESQLTVGVSKTIDVPLGASNIDVSILVNTGFNWSTAYKQTFKTPPTKHLVVKGTTLNSRVDEQT